MHNFIISDDFNIRKSEKTKAKETRQNLELCKVVYYYIYTYIHT